MWRERWLTWGCILYIMAVMLMTTLALLIVIWNS